MARLDLMTIKESLDKIIHNKNLYNETVKTILKPEDTMPEALTERVDTVLRAEDSHLLKPDCSKELAELRSIYIAQDIMEGRVNLLDAKDILSFLKEDENNTFTPKIVTEMDGKTLERIGKAAWRAGVWLSEAQIYEINARCLLLEGNDKDIGYYQQPIRNGIRCMHDKEKKARPIAASKSVQHFRDAIEALQKRYQKYAEKQEPLLAELKETADKSAAANKKASLEFSDMFQLERNIRNMNEVVSATPFTKLNDSHQFLDTVNKYIKDFAKSDGKLEPLQLKPSKLPLIFGRKTAKKCQTQQARTVEFINAKLKSFTPFQLQKLAQYDTPSLSDETSKKIKEDIATRRTAANAYYNQNLDDKRTYEQAFDKSVGMAGFLAESLRTVDKYVAEAKNMQKDKAQKKTAELTGIAPNEKSGTTKVGRRIRQSAER